MDKAIEALYQSTTPRYPELSGQVAVVTGAAQGIGQGIAVRLAREAMRVVLADKDPEKLASTAASLRKLGATISDFLGDLSDPAVIQQLFEQTLSTFQSVDLLVNNAADIQRRRLLDEHKISVRSPVSHQYSRAVSLLLSSRQMDAGQGWRQHHPYFIRGSTACP